MEFGKADSGEKAQEIAGTVWIYRLRIQSQFLGTQAKPNTRNVPDWNSRPLLLALQPQPHHIRFLSTPDSWMMKDLGSFSCQAQVFSTLSRKNPSQTPREHLFLLFFSLKKTQTCLDFRWGCAFVLAAHQHNYCLDISNECMQIWALRTFSVFYKTINHLKMGTRELFS